MEEDSEKRNPRSFSVETVALAAREAAAWHGLVAHRGQARRRAGATPPPLPPALTEVMQGNKKTVPIN